MSKTTEEILDSLPSNLVNSFKKWAIIEETLESVEDRVRKQKLDSDTNVSHKTTLPKELLRYDWIWNLYCYWKRLFR